MEERAQESVANYLKNVLYHFDSYTPLQTKVDSSFVALSNDTETIELIAEMSKLNSKADELAENIEEAERDMDLWNPGGFASAYSKGEYRRAKEDRDYNQELLEKVVNRYQTIFDSIKERQNTIESGSFNGWKVYHRFKSLNGTGTFDIFGEYIFLCDKDFNINSACSLEEYSNLEKLTDIIAKSNNLEEFVENIQMVVLNQ